MRTNQLLEKISKIAEDEQIEIYPVGGFVRDRLLNVESKDIDFVVIGDGIRFAKILAKELGGKNLTVFKTFGTAHFNISDYDLEFVSARKESYQTDSRKPQVEQTDLQTDLSRRDFTINAMAMQINPDSFGKIIDPFKGKTDLADKLIRTPLDPDIAFNDDPLRILRAIRFAARYQFEIDCKTSESIKRFVSRLEIVSVERILIELKQIFENDFSHVGLSLLEQMNLIQFLLPEIVPKIEFLIQFFKSSDSKTLSFQDKLAIALSINQISVINALIIIKRLKLSNEISKYICLFIKHFEMTLEILHDEKTSLSRLKQFLYFTSNFYYKILCITAFWLESQNEDHFFNHLINNINLINIDNTYTKFKLALNGNQIANTLNITGKEIGRIKSKLIELVLNERVKNDSIHLLSYLSKHEKELL